MIYISSPPTLEIRWRQENKSWWPAEILIWLNQVLNTNQTGYLFPFLPTNVFKFCERNSSSEYFDHQPCIQKPHLITDQITDHRSWSISQIIQSSHRMKEIAVCLHFSGLLSLVDVEIGLSQHLMFWRIFFYKRA